MATITNPYSGLNPYIGTGQRESTGQSLANIVTASLGAYAKVQDIDRKYTEQEDKKLAETEMISYNDTMRQFRNEDIENNADGLSNKEYADYKREQRKRLEEVVGTYKSTWSKTKSSSLVSEFDGSISKADAGYQQELKDRFTSKHIPTAGKTLAYGTEEFENMYKAISSFETGEDYSKEDFVKDLANSNIGYFNDVKKKIESGNTKAYNKEELDKIKENTLSYIKNPEYKAKVEDSYNNAIGQYKNMVSNNEYDNVVNLVNKDDIDYVGLKKKKKDILANENITGQTKNVLTNLIDSTLKSKEKKAISNNKFTLSMKLYNLDKNYNKQNITTQEDIATNMYTDFSTAYSLYEGSELASQLQKINKVYEKYSASNMVKDSLFRNVDINISGISDETLKKEAIAQLDNRVSNTFNVAINSNPDASLMLGRTASSDISKLGSIPTTLKSDMLKNIMGGNPEASINFIEGLSSDEYTKALISKDTELSLVYEISKIAGKDGITTDELNSIKGVLDGTVPLNINSHYTNTILKKHNKLTPSEKGLIQTYSTYLSALNIPINDGIKMSKEYADNMFADMGSNVKLSNPPSWIDKDGVEKLVDKLDKLEVIDGNDFTLQGDEDNLLLMKGKAGERVVIANMNRRDVSVLVTQAKDTSSEWEAEQERYREQKRRRKHLQEIAGKNLFERINPSIGKIATEFFHKPTKKEIEAFTSSAKR